MAPKQKKNILWVKCATCLVDLPHKEAKSHSETDCPSTPKSWTVPFILNNVFHCFFDIIIVSELSETYSDSLVLIHHSAIQQCNLVIGEPVFIRSQCESIPPIIRRVWPSNLESITSIYLSPKGVYLHNLRSLCLVRYFK